MRVLQLVASGAESRYFVSAVEELERQGLGVALASIAPSGELHRTLKYKGTESVGFSIKRRWSAPRAVVPLTSLLRSGSFDVVHAHEALPAAVAGAAAKLTAVPAVYHRHHVVTKGRHGLISRIAGKLTSATLAVSGAAAEAARTLDHTRADRVHVTYNGVEQPRHVLPSEVEGLRERLGVYPNERVIVALGRLRHDKGFDVAIASLRHLSMLGCEARLVVVGDGPHRSKLELLARDNGSVIFAGHQRDVSPWYALAEVVLIPSRREAFGLVAAESMAAGKPVVASAVEALPEVIADGETGLLVPPDDPIQLAHAAARLLKDDKTRASMGAASQRRHASMFSVNAMVQRWVACYASVLPAKRIAS